MTDAVLGAKLVEAGYSNGIDDLHKYYLDYYNEKKNTSYTALEQLPDSEIAVLLTSGNTTSVKEQNTEIAELLYNYFYNHLYSLTPAGAGYPGHENNAYTIGSLMRAYHNKQATVFDQSISLKHGAILPHLQKMEPIPTCGKALKLGLTVRIHETHIRITTMDSLQVFH